MTLSSSTWANEAVLFLLIYIIFIKEINYDSPRGGVSVITEKGEVTTSYLLIQKAKISDSGKYTCMPTHANPNTVNVHVLNGKLKNIILKFHHIWMAWPIFFKALHFILFKFLVHTWINWNAFSDILYESIMIYTLHISFKQVKYRLLYNGEHTCKEPIWRPLF